LPARGHVEGFASFQLGDHYITASWTGVRVSPTTLEPCLDAFMAEYVLAGKCHRLMGRAKVVGANAASVCGMQLCIEEIVHAYFMSLCKSVETESSDSMLRTCS
jgi:hypothetical protein